MAEQTANYGLIKPSEEDFYNIDTANANLDKIDKVLGNTAKFEKTGGTGTTITLTGIELSDGSSKTFIASAANNGAATTINSKPLYKPGTTTSPKLIAGKAYTVWYDASGDCFFLKASAEGTASVGNVLAGKTFSNDDDTGIVGTMPNRGAKTFTPTDTTQTGDAGYYSGITVNPRPALSGNAAESEILAGKTFYNSNYTKRTGTMPNRGAVSQSLPINGSYTIPAGYHNGSGKVTQSIPTKAAQTYTPSTSNQTIAAGQYLNGAQTIKGDANLIPTNILSGKSIFGVAGNVVAGRRFASGTVQSSSTTSSEKLMDLEGQRSVSAYTITVSGLSFTPKIIYALSLTGPPGSTSHPFTIYMNNSLSDALYPEIIIMARFYAANITSQVVFAHMGNRGPTYVRDGSFLLPVNIDDKLFYWWAWE